MFGSLGLPEILVILVLALLIFGPKRLPEVGRTIGKGLAEFRRATTDLKRSVNAELSLEEDERPPTTRRPVQGVGRTAAEASASRELPAATQPASAPATSTDEGAESGEGAGTSDAAKAAEDRILESGRESGETAQADATEPGEEPVPRSEASAAPAGTTPRRSDTAAPPDEPAGSDQPTEAASSTQSTHTG